MDNPAEYLLQMQRNMNMLLGMATANRAAIIAMGKAMAAAEPDLHAYALEKLLEAADELAAKGNGDLAEEFYKLHAQL
ncbi:MAG: hypothetical protein ACU0B9_06850 [Limimaricola soesokkakensis]|uniref:hypothetical protein n=1 Tax=Limimaricola soesokkakensis TaxID=1343159 RepID=UPI0040589E5B